MIFGGKWYALKDYPAFGIKTPPPHTHPPHTHTQHGWFQPCELNLDIQAAPSLHTNSRRRLNSHRLHTQTWFFWQRAGFGHVYFEEGRIAREGGEPVVVVLLGDNGELGVGRNGGGFAGYRAKWKHVTQDPLKCNPAQQKKETHIIIKPSWGEAKNHKYYSCTLPTTNTHAQRHTQLPSFAEKWQKMGRLEPMCVCPQAQNDKMMFGNFLIRVCLFSQAKMCIFSFFIWVTFVYLRAIQLKTYMLQ